MHILHTNVLTGRQNGPNPKELRREDQDGERQSGRREDDRVHDQRPRKKWCVRFFLNR